VPATVVNTDVPARIGAHVFLADQVDIGGGHIVYQLKLAGGGGGGVTDHALLTNLNWSASGHTGTPSTIAFFDSGGLAAFATTTGTGTVAVLATNPTIVTPTIASFVNATHNHQSAAGGGLLDIAAISTGTFPIARGGTNSSVALNNNRIIVSSGGAMVEASALTNGQLLIGSTGAAPVAATISAGTGIAVTNGPGSITIAGTGIPLNIDGGLVNNLGVGLDEYGIGAGQVRTAMLTTGVVGLVGDGVTDDGPPIQATLETIGLSGIHSWEVVIESPDPTGSVYINSTVQVQTDRTRLDFRSPVVFGPLGRIRIQGETAELPLVGKPILTADALVGTSTLLVDDATPFSIGDFIVIRGARDATGNPASDQKEYHTLSNVVGLTLTLAEPLEETFLAFNPNPLSPPGTTHDTQVTRVVSSQATVTPARGDRNITVVDTSIYTAGDYVQILDDVHTVKPDSTIETSNYVHREIAEIKAIVSPTVIRVSHALHHTYDTSARARVARLLPAKGSEVRNARVTWSAMSTVNVAFEIKYGVHCALRNCSVAGDGAKTKSWRNQAFRLTDSLYCVTDSCYGTDPANTDSGKGYGATVYGSTYCQVRNSYFSSMRHSILLFNGAAGNLITGCEMEDVCLSDLDLHGAECVDNVFTNCVIVGGDSAATDGATNKAAIRVGNTSHTNGDHYNTFDNIYVLNFPGEAIDVVCRSSNNIFRNIRSTGATTGIRLIANAGNTALTTVDNWISNCEFIDTVTALTQIDGDAGTSMVHGLSIENCRFIRATSGLTVSNASRVRLMRNTFIDPSLPVTTYAINANNVTTFAAKLNELSGCRRGVKLTTCPSARVTGNIMHDLVDTVVLEDAGGNTSALFARNEVYGFTPTRTNSGSGPSAATVDIDDVYISDVPLRHSHLEWNYDPVLAQNSATASTSGSIYLMKISAKKGGLVSNIIMAIAGTAPTLMTAGQNFAGIYDDTGTRIAITADLAATWGSTGLKTCAVTVPVTIQGGRDYYVALLPNSTGVLPTFVSVGGAVTVPNATLSNALQRFSVNGTGQTALPASVTLASNTGTGARSIWVGLS
jgi:hypothetical protein